MESIISGCGKFNRRKDKDLIESRSALVKAWIDDVERAVEKVDKNLPDMMARHIADICYRESERLKKQTTMERKIGEIFEYKGEWYQCLRSPDGTCTHCNMCFDGKCPVPIKECTSSGRRDKTYVIFKKLEKVGEPFTIVGKLYQYYKVFDIDNVCGDGFWCVHNYNAKTLTIEIKALYDKEESEPTLKEFDLEAAKQGKPVCTRDGRKARIICFDVKGDICPIIALVEENGMEVTKSYDMNGSANYKNADSYDLMMLPEKKEGWAVIRRSDIYETEEKAKEVLLDSRIGVMIKKVEWEE